MENLGWGLQMTVLGMGLVFALLALLWVLLTLVLKFDKEEEPMSSLDATDDAEHTSELASAAGAQRPGGAVADLSTDVVAAIMVAVMKHRVVRMPVDLAAAITIAAIKHKKTLQSETALLRSFWPGTQPSRWTTEGRARARQTNNWNPRGK